MIIRFLEKSDIVQHDMVSSQAFSYSCDINDKSSALPCEKVLGAFDDDNKTLFADMEINERECFFGSGILTCAAVGGVAAKPEFRGRGAVKALFVYLDNLNYDIAILYPFSDSYYRKLGFEVTSYAMEMTVSFSGFSNIKRNNDVTLFEGKNGNELLEIYNRCAEKFNLCFKRDNLNEFPVNPYLSQIFTYIWRENSFVKFIVDRENAIIIVKEIYYDSLSSLKGILGFLRNYEGNQKYIKFEKLPISSPILNLVSDIHNCEIKMFNNGSAKILNLSSVLSKINYPNSCKNFSLKIDEIKYAVSIENGIVNIEETEEVCDVEMNIAVASKLILCGFDREEIDYMPGVQINNPNSDFFNAFENTHTFFSDSF